MAGLLVVASVAAAAWLGMTRARTASAAPALVDLSVTADVSSASMTFRGRTAPLPFRAALPPGHSPELIEVTSAGAVPRRFWITLDRPRAVTVALDRAP